MAPEDTAFSEMAEHCPKPSAYVLREDHRPVFELIGFQVFEPRKVGAEMVVGLPAELLQQGDELIVADQPVEARTGSGSGLGAVTEVPFLLSP